MCMLEVPRDNYFLATYLRVQYEIKEKEVFE